MIPSPSPGVPRPIGRRPGKAWRTALVVLVTAGLGIAGALKILGPPETAALRTPECLAGSPGAEQSLTPEQAANASIIAAVAIRRELPARAVTIALATAMQESKLSNIDYGHLDSLGLFQQRPSQGWGTKDQVTDPVYAANAFYDHLVKVPGYRTLPITEAAQAVQRSGFPEAYARHEAMARAFSSALTGNTSRGLSCTLRKLDARDSDPRESADALLSALSSKAGIRAVEAEKRDRPGAGGHGTGKGSVVEIDLTPRHSGSQSTWVLASWLMAHADAGHVISISAEGSQWTREDSPKGWRPISDLPAGLRVSPARGAVAALIG